MNDTWLPTYIKENRCKLIGNYNLKIIEEGNEEEIYNIFTSLLSANTSISELDTHIVEYIYHNCKDIVKHIPNDIPQKERLALLAKLVMKNNTNITLPIKTATDVLRIAVALSDGDISLAEPTKFRNFKRSERRYLLSILDDIKEITEDMLRWKGRWIRLGEKLHPGDYAAQYSHAYDSFQILRNNIKFETFNSKIENAKSVNAMVEKLMERPGEFARRLNQILTMVMTVKPEMNINEKERIRLCLVVIDKFKTVVDKVSTPVLLQTYSFFRYYFLNIDNEYRFFYPKGNVAKVKAIENKLFKLDNSVVHCMFVALHATLKDRFSKNPVFDCNKKVILSSGLEDYIVPFSQRSASDNLENLVRGTKLDINDSDFLRFFIYWKNNNDRVDLDLSAILYDENWNYMNHISYTNLCDNKFQAFHSGDITNAPSGASEFIDIDIPTFVNNGGRYVVMNVLSFTHQPFKDIPTAFAGWMNRENMQSGEIFEPKTVTNKSKLTADTKISIPVVFDLIERKAIWADLALKNSSNYNNVEKNGNNIVLMARSIVKNTKLNVYDLILLHARACDCEIINIDGTSTQDYYDDKFTFSEEDYIFSASDKFKTAIKPTNFEEITKFLK